MKLTAIIERGDDGSYDVRSENEEVDFLIVGSGKTIAEAKEDFNICIAEMRESYEEDSLKFPQIESIEYKLDLKAFLSTYAKTISFVGLEGITGVNRHQLSQYANGYRNPSPKTVGKIEHGIKQFAEELAQVAFV